MSSSRTAHHNRLLLIGWDAADWQFITPLLDAGFMPHLKRLIERGVMGNLATLQPMLSPILWTSIATGKFADAHGICSFLEPSLDGASLQPVSSTSRTTKALWNICSQNKLKSHVVGWYATHPAEPINGVAVSDQFLHVDPSRLPDWPLPSGAVHPTELRDDIAMLRVRPGELGAGDLLPFIPRLAEIDLKHDDRPAAFARVLARASSVHAVATAILDSEPWDFLAVYYDAIDTAGHTFMPFHPPAMSHVAPRDAELYGSVMTGVYQFHDAMLGRLVQLAGDDATIVLVSDHGFHHGNLRPVDEGDSEEERAAKWHRRYGIFAIAGPNVRADERVYGATLLDVAPTALAALGVAPGRDMPGRVLEQVFVNPPKIERVASWDEMDGPASAGLHPPGARVDTVAAAESIKHLVELGYMAAPSNDERTLLDRVIAERQFNLACIYLNSGRPHLAIKPLAALCASSPTSARYALQLAHALAHADRAAEAAIDLLERIENLDDQTLAGARADVRLQLAQAYLAAGRAEDIKRIAPTPASSATWDARMSANVLCGWGFVFRELAERESARACFLASAALEPDRAETLYGLAALAMDAGDPRAAHELGTRATAALYGFPAAHHLLATARVAMGDDAGAMDALDTALRLDPAFQAAHSLAAVVSDRRGDVRRALAHRRALQGHPYVPA